MNESESAARGDVQGLSDGPLALSYTGGAVFQALHSPHPSLTDGDARRLHEFPEFEAYAFWSVLKAPQN